MYVNVSSVFSNLREIGEMGVSGVLNLRDIGDLGVLNLREIGDLGVLNLRENEKSIIFAHETAV